jgi:hypothetical protein
MAHVARFFERSCTTGRGIYCFWRTVHQLRLLVWLNDRMIRNEESTEACIIGLQIPTNAIRRMNVILFQSSHRHVSASLVAIFRVV